METPHIYVVCPDEARPYGGIKFLYRHVDLLNRHGFQASILHERSGFRCTWFENQTRVAAGPDVRLFSTDIAVLPENEGPRSAENFPGIQKVIFNQNCYYTFQGFGWEDDGATAPYLHPEVLGALTVSEDSLAYLAHAFPKLRLFRYHYSIDPRLYAYQEAKKKQLCFMPRKNREDLTQVLNILKFRGALRGWTLAPIHKLTAEAAAGVLRESLLFLSFGHPEGFGLPPAEALACGCLVVGYHGRGGREFFRPEFAWPIEVGDILGYARTVEEVLTAYEKAPAPLREKARRGSAFVLQAYSEAQEAADVQRIWKEILALQAERAPGPPREVPRPRPTVGGWFRKVWKLHCH